MQILNNNINPIPPELGINPDGNQLYSIHVFIFLVVHVNFSLKKVGRQEFRAKIFKIKSFESFSLNTFYNSLIIQRR